MRPIRHAASLALACLFLPLACSDEDPPTETRERFCDRWAEAACSDQVISACQAANVDECRLSQERVCLERIPTTGFVGLNADACLGQVRAAYADGDLTASELGVVLRFAAPCNQLVSGDGEVGSSCSESNECDAVRGLECVFKGSAVTGTCQRPTIVQPGRDCSDAAAVCTEGFYCNGDNCIEGNGEGDACARDEECAVGYCNGAGVCAEGLAVNRPCTLDEECASGFCLELSASERVCTDRVRLSRTDPLCNDLR